MSLSIANGLRSSTVLMTAVAFVTLAGTRKLPVPLIGIGGGAILLSSIHLAGWRHGGLLTHVPGWFWNVAISVAAVWGAAGFLAGVHDLLDATLAMLVILMANKLLTLQRLPDCLHLFVISFLEFLAAAVLTDEVYYALAFLIYLLVAMWALLLYHLSSEAAINNGTPGHIPKGDAVPISSGFFWTTTLMAVVAVMVTIGIFMIMPRVGFGLFQKVAGAPIRTSGFSEHVDLGVMGGVKLDPTLVMRVRVSERESINDHMYFRGAAFDRYTGQAWMNTLATHRSLPRADDGVFTVSLNAQAGNHGPMVVQDVLIEALDTSVLFGVPFVKEFRANVQSMQGDGQGGFSVPYPSPTRFRYTATSIPNRLTEADEKAVTLQYPQEILEYFLPLPPFSPRVAQLAHSVSEHARTVYGKIVAVQRHLLNNYRYSLDVGTRVSATPVQDFLFARKTGYCEHYASAMVVMLRTLGIPARLVTGFLTGEWNNFGQYYIVRQQDAHAWVEVFFPESGWITFDPTPAIAKEESGLAKRIGNVIDSLRLSWDRFVIHYSFRHQMVALQEVEQRGGNLRRRLVDFSGTLGIWTREVARSTITGVMVAVASLMIGVAAIMLLRRRGGGAATRHRSGEAQVIALYERMLGELTRRGLTKPPAWTPGEFSRNVAQRRSDLAHYVGPLTELYYRTRFGRQAVLVPDLEDAELLLRQLKETR
jgi:protein-glutamine gamma-glutamyltransferase